MAMLLFGVAIVALTVGVYLLPRLVRAVRTYLRYRQESLVTCPETQRPAAVRVDALAAAEEAVHGVAEPHLKTCSRWPERADCPQDCLAQIKADPEGCRVWTIIREWYDDKVCVYCHKPIHADDWIDKWLDHGPALLDAKHQRVQWAHVAPEDLPEILANARPVCWSCYETLSFRRKFPELIIDWPSQR